MQQFLKGRSYVNADYAQWCLSSRIYLISDLVRSGHSVLILQSFLS